MKLSWSDIALSWDFLAAILIGIATYVLLPTWVPVALAKDLYGIGITVLSITFAVFFAALAIIMSGSDNEFVSFLEQQGDYTHIIGTMKFTLLSLFLALIVSLFLYAWSAVRASANVAHQSHWLLIFFSFLFFYSLFTGVNATLDSIRFSAYRSRFLTERDAGSYPSRNRQPE